MTRTLVICGLTEYVLDPSPVITMPVLNPVDALAPVIKTSSMRGSIELAIFIAVPPEIPVDRARFFTHASVVPLIVMLIPDVEPVQFN